MEEDPYSSRARGNHPADGVRQGCRARRRYPGGPQVVLHFPTEELRDVCESELHAQREFGMAAAIAVLSLLADLLAADNLQALPPERIRDAADGTRGAYEVFLPDGFIVRLGVRQYAEHHTQDGAVDRSRVRRVMILSVAKPEVAHA